MSNGLPLRLLVNPDDMDAAIGVDLLVRCFGASWNAVSYRWYLQRAFDGEATDRLVLVDGERVVATAGIAYRQLQMPDAALHRVAVMVSACTIPEERRRGCFSVLLQGARAHCASRRCRAMLGFVTADSGTCRALQHLDAAAIPSWYLYSDDAPPQGTPAVLHVAEVATSLWPEYAGRALQPQGSSAVARFHYPDADTWRSQFVERPYPVQLLRAGDSSRAIVEPVGDIDRLQWFDGDAREQGAVLAALLERARRARRRFFAYSTMAALAASLQDCGLKSRAGFMMAMATGAEHESIVREWSTLPWRVHSGDRL